MINKSLLCLLIVSLIAKFVSSAVNKDKISLPTFPWMCLVLDSEFEDQHYGWRVKLHDQCVKEVMPKKEASFQACWKIMNIRDPKTMKKICREKDPTKLPGKTADFKKETFDRYHDYKLKLEYIIHFTPKLAQCLSDLKWEEEERQKFADCVMKGYKKRIEKEKDWPPPN